MSTFSVPDMTCGHCVRSITEAIQAVAPQATVSTDLDKHQVTVQGLDERSGTESDRRSGLHAQRPVSTARR